MRTAQLPEILTHRICEHNEILGSLSSGLICYLAFDNQYPHHTPEKDREVGPCEGNGRRQVKADRKIDRALTSVPDAGEKPRTWSIWSPSI